MTSQTFMQRFPGWTAAEHWARAEIIGEEYARREYHLASWLAAGGDDSATYDDMALTCNALGWAQERHMQAALALSTGGQK